MSKKAHRRVNSLYQALGQQTRAKLKSESLEWATECQKKHSRPQRSRALLLINTKNRGLWEGQFSEYRIVKLDSEHAQSDGKSVNRRLPVMDLPRVRFLVLTKRSAESGDEITKAIK